MNSRVGKVLAFLTKEHCEAKWLLKRSAFFWKSDIILPSEKAGGIIGIFLLFKNLFMTDQYAFGAVSRLSDFELKLAKCLPFSSAINFMKSLKRW